MPTYVYECPSCKMRLETIMSIRDTTSYSCWDCSTGMERVIQAPLLVKVAQDVCYDSPIDGRPITSWAARREDLARNHCREYDPMMRQDYERRIKREDDALDKAVHATVEEAVEKMPHAKRQRLASDLLDKGASLEYGRGNVDAG